MAGKSLNLLLNSALGAMALGIVAFNTGLLDPYLSKTTGQDQASTEGGAAAETASGEQADGSKTGTGDGAAEAETDIASANAESASQGEADAAADADAKQDEKDEAGSSASETPAVIPPRFDIVRVEPDGSVVIAGNASGGSSVEVISGASVLGEATAGAEGDFAVVLSDPLEPGDYTIVLRSTSRDNVVVTSTETAIISVPEDESGDVLAIVDEPGKPSKLITVPSTTEQDDQATAEADGGETEIAAAEPGASGQAADGDTKGEANGAETDSGTGAEPQEEVADSQKADESQEGQSSADDGGEQSASGSEAEEADSPGGTKDSDQGVSEAPAKAGSEDGVQAADAAKDAKADEAKPAGDLAIAVEAVEIEGDQVFVAGTANPGRVVRVYANKDLIGETVSSEIGRFLVESRRGLPVGEYIIRADMLEVGSADVIARAAVPFEREEGETIAAVAPKAGQEAMTEENTSSGNVNVASASDSDVAPADSNSAGKDGTGAGTASGDKVADQGSEGPAPGAQSQMDEEAETAGAAGNEAKPADTGSDNVAKADAAAGGTASDPASGNSEQEDGESSNSGPMDNENASEVAAGANGEGNGASNGEQSGSESEPGTIKFAEFGKDVALTAPKLEKTSGSVIIRRGDTLWRISRRVYGRGIRYTTIYTANKGQIKSPHRIWPGQVFDVPGVSEDGELADMEAIADQDPQKTGENATQ